MALTYSLKYKKLNFYQKVILEKEGEIVIDRQSFRLKGKGAQDQGENIYFGDIKELIVKEDHLAFSTFSKERYVLSHFSNLFDSFLKDFWRVRNEYLADHLFMKVGMRVQEYDGGVEVVNIHGKAIPKGKSRIQFYEGSIVVMPETRECLVVYLDFLKSHEFDEDEYVLRLYLENGTTVHISKFGTSFEDAQQTLESLMSKMYERVIHNLREVLPDFDPATLLKLAYKLKNGRTQQYSTLKKIHDDMPAKLLKLAFDSCPALEEKFTFLRKMGNDENFHIGFLFFNRHDSKDLVVRPWFIFALPEKNIMAVSVPSQPTDSSVHFFRIIMQQGDAKEKLPAKILEMNQSMLLFRFDMAPIYKDKKELRKTKYRIAVKKLSFVRLLRKSYIGRNPNSDTEQWKKDLEHFFAKAIIHQAPLISNEPPP